MMTPNPHPVETNLIEGTKIIINNMADHDAAATQASRKEIYTYTAPWTVYSMSWSRRCVSDESNCAYG
jgi:hypothetical protein